MTNEKRFDPQSFKADQRAVWDDVASGWHRWWRVFEANAAALSARLVERARVLPGQRVLDIATGLGEPAITAARRVGPKGVVVATDLSPEMLAFARERAREANLANLEFQERDAERLDLEPRSFDAALSRWGLMLMLDPAAALRGIRATLVPGGTLAAAVWGTKENVPLLAIPGAVVQRELGLPPPPPDAPGPMRLGRPGQLAGLFRDAGFAEVDEERFELVFELASVAELLRFQQDVSSMLRRELGQRPPADRERVTRAIAAEAKAFEVEGGRVRFRNEVRIAWGRA